MIVKVTIKSRLIQYYNRIYFACHYYSRIQLDCQYLHNNDKRKSRAVETIRWLQLQLPLQLAKISIYKQSKKENDLHNLHIKIYNIIILKIIF